MTSHLKNFWYIIAESHELQANTVLSRQICDELLVCYRDENGQPTVLADRCLHRCGRLSAGTVNNGRLTCPYHGWTYDGQGKVVAIPSLGNSTNNSLKAPTYPTREQDGYIYVRLFNSGDEIQPFAMPYYGKQGWKNIRLQNRFNNNLVNCIENFIDIPHTAFVHTGIFRTNNNEAITAQIKQSNGQVHVTYHNEQRNLGSFNWFLNRKGETISHTDSFYMPNITHVCYALDSQWQYVITSQAVPVTSNQTLVYTEISYHFGWWTPWVKWLVKRQAQKVINQDIHILNQQMDVIKKYGDHFYDTPADKIHYFVSEIHRLLKEGQDPRLLPMQQQEIIFFV